ncbi:hypothetical protein DICA1_E09802 [Diutina catenulata]
MLREPVHADPVHKSSQRNRSSGSRRRPSESAGSPPRSHASASDKDSNSKNLSHVPCKFYKQGICQAGSSCPFSHNLDGSLAADKLPCKYFQKGNCKFGLKCALAHVLPDGTRINQNMLRSKRSPRHRMSSLNYGSNYYENGYKNGTKNSPPSYEPPASEPSEGVATFLGAPMGQDYFGSRSYTSWVTNGSYPPPSAPVYPRTRRSFGSDESSVAETSVASSSWTPRTTVEGPSPFATNNVFLETPHSAASGSPGSSKAVMVATSSAATSYLDSVGVSELAIIDDDDGNASDFEDCIPGSLSDAILTPQELKRRVSRSQSGTLGRRAKEDLFVMD